MWSSRNVSQEHTGGIQWMPEGMLALTVYARTLGEHPSLTTKLWLRVTVACSVWSSHEFYLPVTV